MEGKGRLFDRDDLDEEEKALFDQMVQEEMDKLESQFRSALPPSSERDDDKERSDAGYYQSKEIPESKSMDSNTRRVAPPPRISSSFVASKDNAPTSVGHQFTQERSHAEKIESQREYMRQLDQGVQQQRDSRQGGDNHQEDMYGRGGSVTRHLKSRSEITTGYPVEEDRNGARIGNIGGSSGNGTPTSQKRMAQAAYAKSIADASSALEIGSGVARSSSRRQTSVDPADTDHALSAIGQSSQNGKDNKKQQQLEYARQLQKQMQNNEESREKAQSDGYGSHHPAMSSRGHPGNSSSTGGGGGGGGGGGSYSRGGAREESAYESSYPPSPNGYHGAGGGAGGAGSNSVRNKGGQNNPPSSTREMGSVTSFGADPDAEVARKRAQQQQYARQLQEQQQRDLVRKDDNDARNGGSGGSGGGTTHRSSRADTAGTTHSFISTTVLSYPNLS